MYVNFFFFFFFQAEDGIRDYKVTGVQTCALPISGLGAPPEPHDRERRHEPQLGVGDRQRAAAPAARALRGSGRWTTRASRDSGRVGGGDGGRTTEGTASGTPRAKASAHRPRASRPARPARARRRAARR